MRVAQRWDLSPHGKKRMGCFRVYQLGSEQAIWPQPNVHVFYSSSLLDSDTLGQVAREVHVNAVRRGKVVRNQLER